MLTPSFYVNQTDKVLLLTIHAPYTKLGEVEANAFETTFYFSSPPYFLRLTFPCEVEDDDDPTMRYDVNKGDFEIELKKKEIGRHFPDLDLLGKLLEPRKHKENFKPNIEVLSATGEAHDEEEGDLDDEDDWHIEQELPPLEPNVILNAPKYGFANRTQGVFSQVKSEFKEIIDLPEPDSTPGCERETLRRAEEDQMFCPEHYLADLMEPEAVEECMSYTPCWQGLTPESVKLMENERIILKDLGNKEFLLDKEEKTAAWLSLVDIIFAFAYNHRTTFGENSVESAWTVNKLSATLSWFANHTSPRNVVVCCFRRLLTYPLYRNWDLAQLVLKDTIDILKLGRRQVLKCLLKVHSLFSHSEQRYLLNKLYISDYCIWLQRVSERKLANLVGTLEQISIAKSDVGFDLEELEQAALLVQQEEEEEAVSKKVEHLTLEESSSSSSSEDSATSLDSDDDSFPEN